MKAAATWGIVLAAAWGAPCPSAQAQDPPSPVRRHLDPEWFRRSLVQDNLAHWLAAAPSPSGLFRTKLDGRWVPKGEQCSTLVSQSRLLYVFSVGYELTGDPAYLEAVQNGADALLSHYRDSRYGGWFWSVSESGKVTDTDKNTYGHAFVIFGLSHVYRVTGDQRYLKAALDTWTVVHDRMSYPRGGIAARTDRAFTRVLEDNNEDVLVHTFESLLALHDATGSEEVLRDARTLADFVLERLYQKEAGCLPLNYDRNWEPMPPGKPGYTQVNLGHHFEWAYFLSRAVDKGFPPSYLQPAERLLDYAVRVGYDPDEGGAYWAGRYDGTAVRGPKMWWAQCEMLRALIRYAAVHGREDLWPLVDKTVGFVRERFIDPQNGGWYEMYTPGVVADAPADKGSLWKAGYHETGMYETALCPWGASGLARLRSTTGAQLTVSTSETPAVADGADGLLRLRGLERLALVRFSARAARGRRVRRAVLFLRGEDTAELRYLVVSTVNQDWIADGDDEGAASAAATFRRAGRVFQDAVPWAWPGSSVADVILSSGNSLDCWKEPKRLPDGWLAVPVDPRLVHALAVGDTDGLAIVEGGSTAEKVQTFCGPAREEGVPYLEVWLGGPLLAQPAKPEVAVEPAPEHATLAAGAARVTMAPAQNVFAWNVSLDGRPLSRWQIKHPDRQGPTSFVLGDLQPDVEHTLEVVAVSPGGVASPAQVVSFQGSPRLSRPAPLHVTDASETPAPEPERGETLRVRVFPELVRTDPTAAPAPRGNTIWDGRTVTVGGARGEFVSWQIYVEAIGAGPLGDVAIRVAPLAGPGGATIAPENFGIFCQQYTRDRGGRWVPNYYTPAGADGRVAAALGEPELISAEGPRQTWVVELYVPKDAKPGEYLGSVAVASGSGNSEEDLSLPVKLEVFDFAIPDRLSFWPELNGRGLPDEALRHYQLAQQHRCVLNLRGWRPELEGSGRDIRVLWEAFDRDAGPLLTGEAFAGNPRQGVALECMMLPFAQDWPTPLDERSYGYSGPWPGKGDPPEAIAEHYRTGPYIGLGLRDDYKQAVLAVQKQYVEHFRQKGYLATEMQCSFGGRVLARIEAGDQVWWNLDEPTYWNDWLAVQFLGHLWKLGRGQADPRRWPFRAEIARPQWQGDLLADVLSVGYYPADQFADPAAVGRLKALRRESGVRLRAYLPVPPAEADGLPGLRAMLTAWAAGAEAVAIRKAAGTEADRPLLAPGGPQDVPALAHVRLKELRAGQQLIEYLQLLARRDGLSREQVAALLALDDGPPDAWQLPAVRRRLAERIAE